MPKALDLVFPPVCLCCGAETMTGGLVCTPCFRDLTPIGLACQHCALPVASAGFLCEDGRCAHCVHMDFPWSTAQAAYLYDGTARKLILRYKYADRLEIAPFLARTMTNMLTDQAVHARLIVPVPLHRNRLWRRRFNQAALLARHVSRMSPGWNHVPDALVRYRPTATLAQLAPEARLQALREAFGVRERARRLIEGQHIVLVDDILTTGATASICARHLLAAGAERVDLLVVARTVKLAGESDHQGETQE